MGSGVHSSASVGSNMLVGFKNLLAMSQALGLKNARFDAVMSGAAM